MNSQIERIKTKIGQLREMDKNYQIFGSHIHQYKLNPVLTLTQISEFEKRFQVNLPEEYKLFLSQVGNGGAGPFYGVNTLEDGRISYFDNSENASHSYFDLSKPFPHTKPWNVEKEIQELYDQIDKASEKGDDELEQKLYDQKWELIGKAEHDYGRLYTSDFGCGVVISLIVNGAESGFMWTDDRTNDAGIYPTNELGNTEKLTFLNWYELWLENSINELKNV